jgi:hypothetical protein
MAHIRVPYGPHDAPLAFQRNVSPFNLKKFGNYLVIDVVGVAAHSRLVAMKSNVGG